MGLGEQFVEGGGGIHVGVVTGDKNYRGPRGNISQGGGAFLNHKESSVTHRIKRIPGYRGHKPFADVVPRPATAGKVSSFHFDEQRVPRNETHLVPGYSGWVPGSQKLMGQSHFQLKTPSRGWVDDRDTTARYDTPRSYRSEVGGVVPGYRGHMPGALRTIGGTTYGGVTVRDDAPDHKRWRQSRLTPGQELSALGRPSSASDAMQRAAYGIMQRSGGVVPHRAAMAAVQAAARGEMARAADSAKQIREAREAEIRLKTESGIVNRGVVPGYRGHVPRYRDDIGTSPYRGRGADSKTVVGAASAGGIFNQSFQADPRAAVNEKNVVQIL